MEGVAIEVSDVFLGPPSETPYYNLKDATLRRTHPVKTGHVTAVIATAADLRLPETLSIFHQPLGDNTLDLHSHPLNQWAPIQSRGVLRLEWQLAPSWAPWYIRGLQDITEPTTHDLSTVQSGYLHLHSITLPTTHRQN